MNRLLAEIATLNPSINATRDDICSQIGIERFDRSGCRSTSFPFGI
jgi:hypothetical protein